MEKVAACARCRRLDGASNARQATLTPRLTECFFAVSPPSAATQTCEPIWSRPATRAGLPHIVGSFLKGRLGCTATTHLLKT